MTSIQHASRATPHYHAFRLLAVIGSPLATQAELHLLRLRLVTLALLLENVSYLLLDLVHAVLLLLLLHALLRTLCQCFLVLGVLLLNVSLVYVQEQVLLELEIALLAERQAFLRSEGQIVEKDEVIKRLLLHLLQLPP